MSGLIGVPPQTRPFKVATGHDKGSELEAVETLTRAKGYALAEKQMRRGRQLVISGFIVAVVGIVAYCIVCLSAGVNQDLGSALLLRPVWLIGPTLGVIGLGTLLWLVGSFLYLNGGMNSDPDGPDLYF